jgi:hypothetical protein
MLKMNLIKILYNGPVFNDSILKIKRRGFTTEQVTKHLLSLRMMLQVRKGFLVKASDWINKQRMTLIQKCFFSEFWHEGELYLLQILTRAKVFCSNR